MVLVNQLKPYKGSVFGTQHTLPNSGFDWPINKSHSKENFVAQPGPLVTQHAQREKHSSQNNGTKWDLKAAERKNCELYTVLLQPMITGTKLYFIYKSNEL